MENPEQFPVARRIGTIIGIALSVLIYALAMGPLVYHHLQGG
ncbi:hypothetical protein N183_28160 [Sinorhizobium sp. Sb3]|nr:hypothetical protein N183_28160 [Sinorhizobium sp. Sb3]